MEDTPLLLCIQPVQKIEYDIIYCAGRCEFPFTNPTEGASWTRWRRDRRIVARHDGVAGRTTTLTVEEAADPADAVKLVLLSDVANTA